jgi:probable phosphoglycerate mutase
MAETPAATADAAGATGELVLVRHGETAWSRSGRHTSFSDIELTAQGCDEARAAAGKIGERRFAAVFTSPMRRARDTCALAGLAADVVVTDDLREWDYGEYEGLTTAQIRETNPGWTIFTGDPPGGETAVQVGARADHIIERATAAAMGGDVALFSHGHFLRVLGARWVDLPPREGARLRLDTATICVLGYEHDQRVLHVWNA